MVEIKEMMERKREIGEILVEQKRRKEARGASAAEEGKKLRRQEKGEGLKIAISKKAKERKGKTRILGLENLHAPRTVEGSSKNEKAKFQPHLIHGCDVIHVQNPHISPIDKMRHSLI
jgi:hypothetical protein